MFRENFLGLREFGIASELGVSSLFVPEKLLRSKGAGTAAGSSLPYAEIFLVFYLVVRSSVVPPFASCRSKLMEPPSPPFVPPEPTRMKDRVVCLLRLFYKSRFDAPAVSSCYPEPPPHRGWGHSGRRPFGIPNDTVHPGAAFTTVSPFQRCRNRLCRSLISPNGHQRSCFRTICQTWLNEDGTARADRQWDSTKAVAKKQGEKDPVSFATSSDSVPGVLSGWNERSYQYERRDWYKHLADNCGSISTRKHRRNPRGDTDIDRDSCRSTQTDQFHGRCPVLVKKRGGPRRVRKGRKDLASRGVVIATAS